jgi:Protein of unknown function (DUF3592)
MSPPETLQKQLQEFRRVLFVGAGIVLIGGSIAALAGVYRFTQAAVVVPGVVTKLNAGGSHPQIKFTTQAGETIDYAQNGLIFGYQPGDRVQVMYEPSEPRSAMVDTFGAKWGFPLMMLVMGGVFLGVSRLDFQED